MASVTVACADNWACRLGSHIEVLWPEEFSEPAEVESSPSKRKQRTRKTKRIQVWVDDAQRQRMNTTA